MANQLLPPAPYSLPCHRHNPAQSFRAASQSALCKRPRTLDRNSVDGPSPSRSCLLPSLAFHSLLHLAHTEYTFWRASEEDPVVESVTYHCRR